MRKLLTARLCQRGESWFRGIPRPGKIKNGHDFGHRVSDENRGWLRGLHWQTQEYQQGPDQSQSAAHGRGPSPGGN